MRTFSPSIASTKAEAFDRAVATVRKRGGPRGRSITSAEPETFGALGGQATSAFWAAALGEIAWWETVLPWRRTLSGVTPEPLPLFWGASKPV
jgi:hypothetical protein